MTQFAWLIEAPGQKYLATREISLVHQFFWTDDVSRALRFISKEQADWVMMAVRRLAPELWGFAATIGEAWPREHGYLETEQ